MRLDYHLISIITALFCAILVQTAVAIETFPETNGSAVPLTKQRAAQANQAQQLHATLGTRPPVAAFLELTTRDIEMIDRANRRAPQGAPRRIGTVKPVNIEIDFAQARPATRSALPQATDQGVVRQTNAGRLVWALALDADGAEAVRLKLDEVNLPDGAALYLYNDLGEVRGPYRGGQASFWTHSIRGETVYLQAEYPDAHGPAADQIQFRISEALLVAPSFYSLCTDNAYCIQDASCYDSADWPAIDQARKAIAMLTFIENGNGFSCTGGLLTDTDDSSFIPYFLTANHCLSTQNVASTVETFFDYRTNLCGGACSSPGTPSTLGATLLNTSAEDDHTLLRLDQQPPAGSVFLGWTDDPVAFTNGKDLYRLSHPKGSPQAFSKHSVTTTWGCFGLPRGQFIYSLDLVGATEGGSSGSPVITANGQVVGQQLGACGSNLDDVCDSDNNATVDGAFANYYSDIERWLNPAQPTPPPPPSCQGDPQLCLPSAGGWRAVLVSLTQRSRSYSEEHDMLRLADPDVHGSATVSSNEMVDLSPPMSAPGSPYPDVTRVELQASQETINIGEPLESSVAWCGGDLACEAGPGDRPLPAPARGRYADPR